jgi:hypothetical protein
MRFRRKLFGSLFAVAVAVVATVVPASAARADLVFINYREIVNTGSFKCLQALGIDRNSPVGQRSCQNYSVQTWALLYMQTINGIPYYQLANQYSQLCLEVQNGSYATGAAVDQFLCSSSADQLWRLYYVSASGPTYVLVNYNSGKCLDVSGASRDDSARIQQWDCNGTVAQKWWIL